MIVIEGETVVSLQTLCCQKLLEQHINIPSALSDYAERIKVFHNSNAVIISRSAYNTDRTTFFQLMHQFHCATLIHLIVKA